MNDSKPKMKHHNEWDKLQLTTKEIEGINLIIAKGIHEGNLLNMMINVHNRGFKKGVNKVFEELENLK